MPIDLSHWPYEQAEVLSSPGVLQPHRYVGLYNTCSSYSTQITEQKCRWAPVGAILGQNPPFERMTVYWGAWSSAALPLEKHRPNRKERRKTSLHS